MLFKRFPYICPTLATGVFRDFGQMLKFNISSPQKAIFRPTLSHCFPYTKVLPKFTQSPTKALPKPSPVEFNWCQVSVLQRQNRGRYWALPKNALFKIITNQQIIFVKKFSEISVKFKLKSTLWSGIVKNFGPQGRELDIYS